MTVQAKQTITDWLAGIAAPLPGTPSGDDPRYRDDFQQVKEESDKLRDVDYPMIMTTCRDLLIRVTKDLRLGGYHLVAGLYVDGLHGLLEGLAVYRTLLENFWETCHPQTETARMAALNLLSNPRILAFAEQREEGTDPVTFEILQAETAWINAFLIEKLGEDVPRLAALAQWAKERQRRLEPATPPAPNRSLADPSPSVADMIPQESLGVTSERAVETLTRQIHRYLIESGQQLRAMAYSRALRWGKPVLPPSEDGRTRIPPPRTGGLTRFDKILVEGSPEEILACSENLLFEPGFPLLFDIQYRLHQHLETNRRPDLAGFVRHTLLDLLERHPQLLELQFEDGTPFAGPECRQWIQGCRPPELSGNGVAAQTEKADAEMAEAFDQAMQLAKRNQLPEALLSLDALPARTEKQRLRKRLAEARLCQAVGKVALAEMVLADIQTFILSHHLATWDPDLALEILRQRLAALQALEKTKPREGNRNEMQEVRQLICRLDVAAAASLI